MIRGFVPRLYQETIFSVATQKNCLVVLPTGLGKTTIAMLLAAHRLKLFPTSKVLFLAPTKPLCQQHFEVFRKGLELEEDSFALFTGELSPEKRAERWKSSRVIISTPQGFENDIVAGRISLKDVSLLVFDECHRAVGGYSYVWIAKRYMSEASFPRILGLTASPGSELEKIEEVCKNLFINAVEVRSYDDPDVKPYVQKIEIQIIKLELPDSFKAIQQYLLGCYKQRIDELISYGLVRKANLATKKDLLEVQAKIHSSMAAGNHDWQLLKSASTLAQAIKIHHALELLESQGIIPLHTYLSKIFEEANHTRVRAIKVLVKDNAFVEAFRRTQELFVQEVKHPKMLKLREIVSNEISVKKDIKIIVFTQYRDTGNEIVQELNDIPGVNARLFVGQAKKGETGLKQKEQKELIEQFHNGNFNVLVATSVAEEGLDIPKVDLVVFFEPIPSAIRTIQRRGRTGRHGAGRVIVLIAKKTRDEAYGWVARRKEKRMEYILKQLKEKFDGKAAPSEKLPTVRLDTFITPKGAVGSNDGKAAKPKILVDHRESGSPLLRELSDLGVEVSLSSLPIDYQLSSRVGVEHKTVQDFVNSILDGRLLEQLKVLAEEFERPLLVIEGQEDMYALRGVHPNAIRGALATVAVSYGIPVLQTRNPKETAALLYAIAQREQETDGRDFSRHSKKPLTLREQQEYIVSAFPNVGGALAKELLRRFRTVRSIVNASPDELKKVDGIGDKKATRINEVLTKDYTMLDGQQNKEHFCEQEDRECGQYEHD
ncbi:MAG: DEAD/DEAH box helicase [Candidatus Woesearchaeota archaeon]